MHFAVSTRHGYKSHFVTNLYMPYLCYTFFSYIPPFQIKNKIKLWTDLTNSAFVKTFFVVCFAASCMLGVKIHPVLVKRNIFTTYIVCENSPMTFSELNFEVYSVNENFIRDSYIVKRSWY